MVLTVKSFNKSLEKKFLYESRPSIAVGVSGGPDSLALVILLSKWVKEKNGKLVALIIDHKIRKESTLESLKIKKYLIKLEIKCKILSVAKSKVKQGKQIQARTNRFNKLINYCKKNNIFHLFFGHHFNDNIETFILRKIAGSDFEGLNGMQYITSFKNIQIIRPLLSYMKDEIIFFNKKNNIQFLQDPSNNNIKYSRVAIRKYLDTNKNKYKKACSEFKLIRNNYVLYKKMIFRILILIIVDTNFNKVIFNAKKFFLLNEDIRDKILFQGMKFVNNSSFQIRSKKINIISNKIYHSYNIVLQSQKTLIKRFGDIIIITKA